MCHARVGYPKSIAAPRTPPIALPPTGINITTQFGWLGNLSPAGVEYEVLVPADASVILESSTASCMRKNFAAMWTTKVHNPRLMFVTSAKPMYT